ncbi:MAG: hypothetical protein QOD75_3536 [Blastocatellia bacterium]|jgi:hypothetical protein|nr:hypothetical protein [Blastocatellia bacterium]
MAKLKKFTLRPNKKKGGWDLRQDKTNKLAKHFRKKETATKRNVLRKATGGESSVKIMKENGRLQEERTYPQKRDPSSSPG